MPAAFALTIFCGSFLLFLVEPIIAKELLPWFGGAANVWATCLVFFQVGLLLGYAYADVLVRRVPPRMQLVLQLLVIVLAGLSLPIIPAAHWKLSGAHHPSLSVLGALATTVGIPYFSMAATSPLVQSWYARRFPQRSPYPLFALSNLASMLALIAYPSLLEPWLGTRMQSYVWSAGYALWAILMLLCAAGARTRAALPQPPSEAADEPADIPRLADYLAWVGLAALGSVLLIAVTNYMTRDVAAIPLLWILPLAIYLLTFIVSFQGSRRLPAPLLFACGMTAVIGYAAYAGYTSWPGDSDTSLPIWAQLTAMSVVLACACLFCHGRLALTRPAPRYLTRFYLMIAAGGAAGSILIGLAAPALLRVDFDLQLSMVACGLAVLWGARALGRVAWLSSTAAALAVLGAAGLVMHEFYENTVLTRRNFYGSLHVSQWNAGTSGTGRSLMNGAIVHGTQFSAPNVARRPTEYYGAASGVGLALTLLQSRPGPHRIGVIGLGAGTLAAYGRHGDVVRFYDINPAVLDIATHEFTYVRDSPATIEVALGDARLSLEREPPQRFDLLAVDAFSGDAIPVHLLTREAIGIYLRHLNPDGVLAIHTSNRYVNLPPVVERLSEIAGLSARLIEDDSDDTFDTPSSWVLVARNAEYFKETSLASAAEPVERIVARPWTDDFSDLLKFVRWRRD